MVIFGLVPIVFYGLGLGASIALGALGMYFAGDETTVTYEGDVTNEGGDGSTFGGTGPGDGGERPDALGPVILKALQVIAPLTVVVLLFALWKRKKKKGRF